MTEQRMIEIVAEVDGVTIENNSATDDRPKLIRHASDEGNVIQKRIYKNPPNHPGWDDYDVEFYCE